MAEPTDINAMIASHPMFTTLAEPRMFSLDLVDPESPSFLSIRDCLAKDGLVLLRIHKVSNPITDAIYKARINALEFVRGKDGVNEDTAYHVANKTLSIPAILQHGLKTGLDRRCKPLFGNGVYSAQTPGKANDYSPMLGNPAATRFMFQLKVAKGRVFQHPVGHFNQQASSPPPGYDSVSGFVRRSTEFVFYDHTGVKIEFLIEYESPDTARETAFPLTTPANVPAHQIAHITPGLSVFFNELRVQSRSVVPSAEELVKTLISDVLTQKIDADTFCAKTRTILKLVAPSEELLSKFRTHLAKCKFPPPAPEKAESPAKKAKHAK